MTLFEIDPNSVVAGWIPLVMTAILAVAMVFLFRSMRKQMGRIDVPRDAQGAPTPSERVERDEESPRVDSTRE